MPQQYLAIKNNPSGIATVGLPVILNLPLFGDNLQCPNESAGEDHVIRQHDLQMRHFDRTSEFRIGRHLLMWRDESSLTAVAEGSHPILVERIHGRHDRVEVPALRALGLETE